MSALGQGGAAEPVTAEMVLKDGLGDIGGESEEYNLEADPDWSHPPRLFECRPDGTGVELLRDSARADPLFPLPAGIVVPCS